MAACPVTICGPNIREKPPGLPVLNETEGIRLNGFEAAGEAYETFHLRGTDGSNYPGMAESCKTDNKPYDEVVTAILIAAVVYSRSSVGGVMSDCNWSHWSPGIHLFEMAVRPLTEDEKIALELDVESMRPRP